MIAAPLNVGDVDLRCSVYWSDADGECAVAAGLHDGVVISAALRHVGIGELFLVEVCDFVGGIITLEACGDSLHSPDSSYRAAILDGARARINIHSEVTGNLVCILIAFHRPERRLDFNLVAFVSNMRPPRDLESNDNAGHDPEDHDATNHAQDDEDRLQTFALLWGRRTDRRSHWNWWRGKRLRAGGYCRAALLAKSGPGRKRCSTGITKGHTSPHGDEIRKREYTAKQRGKSVADMI